MDNAPDRIWTKWSDKRPPNERGEFRYRASFNLLSLPVSAEWQEKMHLCGMGYGDSEWWPLSPCHWDGYTRKITNNTLEWSHLQDGDIATVAWHGLDLLPCPFTGQSPIVTAHGRYIGAPLWHTNAVTIHSHAVPSLRFTDAKKMVAAWNTRATPAREAAEDLVEAIKAALAVQTIELNPSNYSHDDACQLNNEMIEVWQILTAALARAKGGF